MGHPSRPSSAGRRAGRWRGLVLAVGLAVGCGEDEPGSVQAARRFVHAVQAGEVAKVLELVDAEAVAYVQRAAARASDQVGGRRNVEGSEMLQVVDVDPHFQVQQAELVEGDERRALVRLHGADDTTRTLDLVNENGEWKVKLPLPRRTPMVETGEP
jgi:hypothetical protein